MAFQPINNSRLDFFAGQRIPRSTTPITSSLSSSTAWMNDPNYDGPSICPAAQYGSTLIKIPAPGTENDDHNPPRIAPRNLFDLSLGDDDLFHGDRYKWSVRVTVINVTNKVALYNFLSTFSGTHYRDTPSHYRGTRVPLLGSVHPARAVTLSDRPGAITSKRVGPERAV